MTIEIAALLASCLLLVAIAGFLAGLLYAQGREERMRRRIEQLIAAESREVWAAYVQARAKAFLGL